MTKDQEMEVIRTGAIQYKDIEIQEVHPFPFSPDLAQFSVQRLRS